MDEEAGSNLSLPDAFLDFLNENGLDPSIYTTNDSIPRYIRLKPGCEAHLEEIEAEIKCKLEKVAWLPCFYSLPPQIQIARSKAYQEGKIYGIDAASGAAVSALNISLGDHVLDLCAAPGAKLCMILDLLGSSGSVTGVDVARHRLAACRTMLQKYALGDHCRLFVADGTTFSLIPTRGHLVSQSCESSLEIKVDEYKEWTSRRPWKERKKAAKARDSAASPLLQVQNPELIFYGRHSGVVGLSRSELYQTVLGSEVLHCGYDKVLVDAECTHDGSIRHIQKFENWGWKTLQRRVLNAERTDDLTILQLPLIRRNRIEVEKEKKTVQQQGKKKKNYNSSSGRRKTVAAKEEEEDEGRKKKSVMRGRKGEQQLVAFPIPSNVRLDECSKNLI